MNSTPFDPSLLQAMVALAETLSFSKAALQLDVTKGTISRKLAQLEAKVGTELVRRTTHHVTLTLAGRQLYERAREPLRALSAITSDLPVEAAELAGEISVTAPRDLGTTLLPPIFERFSLLHPGVTFQVRLTNTTLNLVAENVDVAVRILFGRSADSGLVGRRIGEVLGGFYASPSYVARRGEPAVAGDPNHDWLQFDPGPQSALKRRRGERPGRRPHGFTPKFVTDDFFLLREMIGRGLGVGGLAGFFAEPLVRSGSLVRVMPQACALPAGRISLMAASGRAQPQRVQAFREHLIESFAKAKK